jgi:protein TonB
VTGTGGFADGIGQGETDNVPPEIFTPVERLPEVVLSVRPEYPPLAARAGIEGNVSVNIWVTKEGKPRKAVVLRSTHEMFNEAAITAAMKFVFTPALMNGHPVAVWVSIPFKFRMKPN